MRRRLRVIQYLIHIRAVCPHQNRHIAPPFPQVRRNFDVLVHPLAVAPHQKPALRNLPRQISLVAVCFAVDRLTQQSPRLRQGFIQHRVDRLLPKPPVQVRPTAADAPARQRREVLAAVGRVQMRNAVAQQQRILRLWRMRLEQPAAGRNVPQL